MKRINIISNKGITLIALVITVIILLILAGTAISISINGGDLFGRSQNAVAQYNNRVAEEEDALYNVLEYMGITRLDTVVPTAPTGIISIKVGGTSIKVQATGGTDNSGTVLYKYSRDNGTTWSDAIPSSQVYTFTGLTKSTEYTITAKSVDNAGNESGEVETKLAVSTTNSDYDGNIGRYVHYNINLGIGANTSSVDDDWVVFYEDETNGLTYLIAADYVPNTNTALTAARTALGFTDSGTYNVYSSSSNASLKTSIASTVATRNRLSWYNSNRTISKFKHKAVASLLDLEAWDGFVLKNTAGTEAYDSSIQAVGGPTVDLWVASWNQRGYTPLYLATNTDEAASTNGNGYYVGTSENPTSTYQSIAYNSSTFPKTGYNSSSASASNPSVNNKVYFPHTAGEQSCYGYWLASPSAYANAYYVMSVYYDGSVDASDFRIAGSGVRPVVSLSSSIIGENNASEIYYLETNIND